MEKSKRYDANVKTVQAVKDAGSDFAKLHAIEHHLYCYTEESFDLLMALGREAGYEVAHEGRHEGDDGPFWSLDLVRKSTPDIFSIEKQALEIEAMAEKADADYDGWGTEVET
jgi:regulator of ribonuclease activity B